MREICFILMPLLILMSCAEDEGNACRSFYNDLCSQQRYFDEPEEYYYQQKVLFCNCIKNKRSEFTEYEKIECDRLLESIDILSEDIESQKEILQRCAVDHKLLDKYKDTYISICQMRNGIDNCKTSKKDCLKSCPTSSDEEYNGCVAKCNAQYPCDEMCDGFEY